MSKLTKQMECQQRINQEAQKLMKHFGEEVDLSTFLIRRLPSVRRHIADGRL